MYQNIRISTNTLKRYIKSNHILFHTKYTDKKMHLNNYVQ